MSWRGVPIFGLLLFVIAGMMLIPCAFAALEADWLVARAFLAGAVITATAAGLYVLATLGRPVRSETASEFSVLLSAFVLAPVAAAIPVALSAPYLSVEAAYFEMVSTFTTTGATVFDRVGELSPALNLWRGLTAWLGGLIALLMAFALLAPRNLGGFEVRGDLGRRGTVGRLRGDPLWAGGSGREAAADRIGSAIRVVLPTYASLTAVLAVLLTAIGQEPGHALIAAMSILSTSGVSPVDGPIFAGAGSGAEIVAAVFLIVAVTRHSYGGEGTQPFRFGRIPGDPEIRILAVVVAGATIWLFLRHWLGALDLADGDGEGSIQALWGALFTTLSFATTTGIVSESWQNARMWSGLENPALVLFGLAITGGGIATTAGGVKLMRAYALFKHGSREMERLVRPSSISGSSAKRRGLRREGAQIAWVFVMLFLVALALTILALSLAGLEFDQALAASVAALTNTGPIFPTAVEDASWLTSFGPEARAVLCLAMVLGRVELLALIAILNADNWR